MGRKIPRLEIRFFVLRVTTTKKLNQGKHIEKSWQRHKQIEK